MSKNNETEPQITRRDVESFGRVLKVLGRFVEDNADRVLEILGADADTARRSASHGDEPTSSVDVFELARNKPQDELLSHLEALGSEELRGIIKANRLGSIKSRSAKALAEHIVEQLSKRSVDVFRTHGT